MASLNERICSSSTCKVILPPVELYKWKSCEKHRQLACESMKRKRASGQEASQSNSIRPALHSPLLSRPIQSFDSNGSAPSCCSTPREKENVPPDSDDVSKAGSENDRKRNKLNDPVQYESASSMFCSLKLRIREKRPLCFHGCYQIDVDPLVDDSGRIRMIYEEIWKLTGYRFTIKDHRPRKFGRTTRYWCSQDQARKQKSKKKTGSRDNEGMDRFDCKSSLLISVSRNEAAPTRQVATIHLEHEMEHIPYYDVRLPLSAQDLIRENLWASPSIIAAKVQEDHPHITPQQVYHAWVKFSEGMWKRCQNQLDSAKMLLQEMEEDAEILPVKCVEDVQALAWGLKYPNNKLSGKVVEIGIDATYNTNAKDMELYVVIAEHDNTGIPLAYCLLTTASSICPGKRKIALESFFASLQAKYNISPRFVHTDKDIAEIKSSQVVWVSSKHQLCWWHMRKAVRKRLKESKLGTSPYHLDIARAEFPFIDPTFIPRTRPDPNDTEDPDLIPKNLPASTLASKLPPPASNPNALPIKISIPKGFTFSQPTLESSAVEEETLLRIFCPAAYREPIINLMESHLCAHPLIPGECAPSCEGIRMWAVKQIYEFCYKHGLREVWAYLWENWYCCGRWELWARAVCDEIPRLKTTMMCEAHWRRIKHDFLHFFHKPRLDLLVWIIMDKLMPHFYQRLKNLFEYNGRSRNLPVWRKEFKKEWKSCEKREIPNPANPKYVPDVKHWVCTCPAFVRSRFLICKHLIQLVHPVTPRFFKEASRNRSSPFWEHLDLRPCTESSSGPSRISNPTGGDDTDDETLLENDEDLTLDLADQAFMVTAKTFDERFDNYFTRAEAFMVQWKHQQQFRDMRFQIQLEQSGRGFFRFIDACNNLTHCMNSSGRRPNTWESGNTMFFRTPPPDREAST